jgi:hypothetical protein
MTTITGQEARDGADKKALQINLDAAKYGTFAEIGAGQEVARQFFHVGGASGTIAKTISAYDMTFSDAIYGPCPRYVSRQRLQGMLDYEYKLLIERLADKRARSLIRSSSICACSIRKTSSSRKRSASSAST